MQTLSSSITQLAGKRVLVRANFDVPLDDGQVGDVTRIEDAVSTIKLLLDHNCQVQVLAHAGRPEGEFKAEFSLKPVADTLAQLLQSQVNFIPYTQDISQTINQLKPGVNLLDNLRFYPGEEANDPEFVNALASLGEVYVNQAFANCHRAHASMVGLPGKLPSYAGVNLEKEVNILTKVRTNPDRPLVVVIGGAKLETKEPLVSAFVDVADKILVGGKIATDMASRETPVPSNVVLAQATPDGRDITEESAEQFAQIVRTAETIMWNGTMGVFEEEHNRRGTTIVAQAINDTPAYTIVGGGDTEAALTVLQLESGIDFISTGGGAMLTFLSEGKLVALEALK